MASPAETIRNLLVGDAIISATNTADWFGQVSNMHDAVDRAVSLHDYGGGNPNPKWNIDRPSVQVVVRSNGNDYTGMYNKAVEIKDALLGLDSQDIDGVRWISISMVGDINSIGRDEKNRPACTLNFSILKEAALGVGANREAL